MNAFFTALLSVLASIMERTIVRSRTGVDADDDVGRLSRAGRRISDWMRQSRIREGVKSNADGSKRVGSGLPLGGSPVGPFDKQS